LHWLVTGIAGPAGDVTKGHTVVAYAGPTPPEGTHRYLVLVAEQSAGAVAVEAPGSRGKFSVADLCARHSLVPVAARYWCVAAAAASKK